MDIFNRSYLIERALGAIVYCLVILLFFFVIGRCRNFKQLKIAFIFYTLILTVMAFIYIPETSVDVTRWYSLGNEWKTISFTEFMKNEVFTSRTPVAYIYVYLCCMTGIKGFLSGVTALLFYSCTFYLLYIIFKSRKQVEFKNISLVVFFTMCSGVFLSVIGGIRSALAFSIVLACFYKESIKGRGFIVDIVFLVLACLLHTAAFVVVAIRYFAFLFANKRIKTWLKIILLVAIGVASIVLLRGYLNEAISKFEAYSSETVYFSGKSYISTIVIFVLELIIFLSFFSRKSIRLAINYEQRLFIIAFVALEILLLFNFVMLARFGIVLLYLLPLPLIELIEGRKTIGMLKGRTFAICLSIICLFLNYTCGDLSAYKFIVL